MKLKSKLIATIVSICAAVAVMGVGVWAASTSFTVSVQNTVNISFQNLVGTVHITGWADADDTVATASLGNPTAVKIFDSADPALDEENHLVTGTQGAGATKTEVADFLVGNSTNKTNITADTKEAVAGYTVYYTPSASVTTAGVSSIKITLTEGAKPTMQGGTIATTYYIGTSAAGEDAPTSWYPVTVTSTASSYYADASLKIYVLAVCEYTNANGVSVTTTATAWNFEVGFEAAALNTTGALTGAETLTGVGTGTAVTGTATDPQPTASVYRGQ